MVSQDTEAIRAALKHAAGTPEATDARLDAFQALDRLVARLEAAEQLARAVIDFANHAPAEWDGGDLGYEVGGLGSMADDVLAALAAAAPGKPQGFPAVADQNARPVSWESDVAAAAAPGETTLAEQAYYADEEGRFPEAEAAGLSRPALGETTEPQ